MLHRRVDDRRRRRGPTFHRRSPRLDPSRGLHQLDSRAGSRGHVGTGGDRHEQARLGRGGGGRDRGAGLPIPRVLGVHGRVEGAGEPVSPPQRSHFPFHHRGQPGHVSSPAGRAGHAAEARRHLPGRHGSVPKRHLVSAESAHRAGIQPGQTPAQALPGLLHRHRCGRGPSSGFHPARRDPRASGSPLPFHPEAQPR